MIRIFEPVELEHLAELYAADLADLEEYSDCSELHETLTREVDLLLEELGYRNVAIDTIEPRKRDIYERSYLEAAFCEDYCASVQNITTDILEVYCEELANQGYSIYSDIFEAEVRRRRAEEQKVARRYAWA